MMANAPPLACILAADCSEQMAVQCGCSEGVLTFSIFCTPAC